MPGLVTLAVGLLGSGRPQMWGDELASWTAANRTVPQLFGMLHHVDAVYGVYYVFLHFWMQVFGDSAVTLRVPSAIAMAVAAAFIALTGRRLFSRRAGLLAGLIFAVVPSVSRYAQEVRPYAIVMAAVAIATWCLLRALERPTLLRWVCYGVSIAAVGLFQLVALSLLLPHACMVILQSWPSRPWRRWAQFAVTVLVAVLPAAPLALLGQAQVGKQISWIDRPTPESLPALWEAMYGPALFSLLVLAAAAMTLGWAKNRRPVLQVFLTAVLPVALVYFVSQGSISYFIARYLLFTLSAWVVLAGAGLAAIRPRVLAIVGVIVLAVASYGTQVSIRSLTDRVNFDERGAARVVAQGYQQGDGLVVPHDSTIFDSGVKFYLPKNVKPRDIFESVSPAAGNSLVTENCAQPVSCLGAEPRIWVVSVGPDQPIDQRSPYANIDQAQGAALASKYHAVHTTHLYNTWVTLLERNS